MVARAAILVCGVTLLVTATRPVPASAQSADLHAKAEAGKAAMAAGRFDEAVSLYAEVVKALPAEPGMRLNLGIAQAMAGRPADAVPHLESALKLQPNLLPASLFLGAAHMQLGRPARAVGPLEKVVAADPSNVQARQMLADALFALERWEPASRQYRKLTELAPDQAPYWYGLGRCYEAIGGAAFDRLQRTAPESVWILLLTAQALAAEGRHANAYRLYREALAKQPVLREAREAVADIYDRTGHPAWAAAERDRARQAPAPDCRQHPLGCDYRAGRHMAVLSAPHGTNSAESNYWVARSAGELARTAFVRLDALPASAEGTLVKADVLGRQRRHVEAATELRGAAAGWPRDARIRHALARELYLARDFHAARPLLEELRKQDEASVELAFLLGDTLLQEQQPTAAIPLLEKAVTADPGQLPARAALGQALSQAGEFARAIPHLIAAAGMDEDGSLHYQLARAYQAAGQAEPAARALERSQQLRQAAQTRQLESESEFQITPPSE